MVVVWHGVVAWCLHEGWWLVVVWHGRGSSQGIKPPHAGAERATETETQQHQHQHEARGKGHGAKGAGHRHSTTHTFVAFISAATVPIPAAAACCPGESLPQSPAAHAGATGHVGAWQRVSRQCQLTWKGSAGLKATAFVWQGLAW